MRETLSQIYRVYRPFQGKMLGVLGFIAISQALSVGAPYISGSIIDALNNQNFDLAIKLVFAFAGIYFLRIIFIGQIREHYELTYIDFKIPRFMNSFALGKIFGFSLGQHMNENSGIKQSVIGRGQHSMESMVRLILYQLFPMTVQAVIMISVLIWMSFWMGIALLIGVIVYGYIIFWMNNKFRKDFKEIEKMWRDNSRFQGEVLRNIDLVKINAREERARKDCDANLGRIMDRSEMVWKKYNFIAAFRNLLPITIRLVIGLLGVYYVSIGKHSTGMLVTFWAYSNQAMDSITQIGSMHRQLVQMWIPIKRFFRMINIPSNIEVKENAIVLNPIAGDIEYRNVTMRYENRSDKPQDDDDELEDEDPVIQKELALENVSLHIRAGERVAFVGESGAGKSSFVYSLLRGQDPDQGAILIDGVNLRDLDLRSYLTQLGVVPQNVPLFDESIRYNITYGLSDGTEISDIEIDRVAKMASIDRFFDKLEKGYDTYIGERGIKLSGGERQRIGIARALIKNPRILILDEATSSLDAHNEALVRESIEEASKGRTTIIIAHRFSTIKNVDRIFVFDKGQIVAEGTHNELMQSCQTYQNLVRHQLDSIEN